MKKVLISLILFLSIVGFTYAQAPEAINYQAVARNGSGALISNQNLIVRVGIYSGVGGATKVYEETHTATTNQYGMFGLQIGNGTVVTGTFSAIAWGADEHHLNVEVDPGTGYVDLGKNQLMSVPYALSAGDSKWDENSGAIYYNDGKVGIGTSTPDHQLSVHTTSGISYIRVSDNTTGPSSGLRMGLSGSGNAYIINDMAAKSLSLGTDGTSQLRILDGGEVGINQLLPAMQLHVKQSLANKGFRIEHQSTTDSWDNGVGTTTKNYKFYYNGLFRADISSVDGSYVQSSDFKLKKDVQYMEPVLGKVMQLKAADYHYIDGTAEMPRSFGFIAQEVEPIFPDLVRETDNGFKGLVYDGFAVVSIKAIQELNEKMDKMQAEIDELKKMIKEK